MVDTNNVVYNTHDIWVKTNDGFMSIDNIDPKKSEAYGIRKFIIEDNRIKEIRYAQSARYKGDNVADVYNISKISYPIKDQEKHINVIHSIDKTNWSNPIPISIAQVITINDNDYLNFNQLSEYMLSTSQAKNESLSLKFWQEIFQPISLMILILLSVPLSIGSTRSSTLIIKLLLGAFFGFSFFIVNQIFGPIALILHIPPIFGAAGPTVCALILLIYLFIKSKET